jgi:hypothetical protein
MNIAWTRRSEVAARKELKTEKLRFEVAFKAIADGK